MRFARTGFPDQDCTHAGHRPITGAAPLRLSNSIERYCSTAEFNCEIFPAILNSWHEKSEFNCGRFFQKNQVELKPSEDKLPPLRFAACRKMST
jgi:hypothetical protein